MTSSIPRDRDWRNNLKSENLADDVLLDLRNLTVSIERQSGFMDVVRDVSFTIDRGETIGLVGESGSGKSVLASSIMGVLASEDMQITGGEILFDGLDLRLADSETYRRIRGSEISIILQDSLSSLNPVMTIFGQIEETVIAHTDTADQRVRDDRTISGKVLESLEAAQYPNPTERMQSFPHQLSGGMRQRAAAAMALVNGPRLLIADEPTTALDVTVQAQFLRLLRSLGESFSVSILFISHDLSVVGQIASRILVMYGGKIMEDGPPEQVLLAPQHPYTEALVKAIPTLETRGERLAQIPGFAPSPDRLPTGCPFRDRCEYAQERCEAVPPLTKVITESGLESSVACWFPLSGTGGES